MADADPFATELARQQRGQPAPAAAPAATGSADPFAEDAARHRIAAEQETSQGRAFGKGILNAATFNFLDELYGLGAAGGLSPDDPDVAHAVAALMRGAYKKVTGDPEAEKIYRESRDIGRSETKQLEAQYPKTSLAGNVAGALAVPVAVGLRAATLPGRIGGAALTGAGTGALAGFGAGEGLPGSLAEAAKGGAIGAAAGSVLAPVTEGLVRGAGALAAPAVNTIRGLLDREGEAQRRVAGGIARDVAAGNAGLTPAEYAAAQASGAPVALTELGGSATRALARSAANTSPEARAALERTTQDRYLSTGERLTDWLNTQFHFPDAAGRQAALDVAERGANRAAYTKAYSENPSVWSPELERLTTSSDVIAAMKAAQSKANSRAVVEGIHYAPLNSNAFIDEAGQLYFRGKNGTPTYPDLRFWDYTRRELSQEAQKARRAGAGEDASRYAGLANLLNQELDRIAPSYQAARQGAAGFFGAENALQAGQNFVGASQRYGIPEAQRAIARMTPQQRQLFQDGYVSRFIEQIGAKGGAARTTMLNRIQQAPQAMRELETALGHNNAQELLARLRIESVMDRMRGALGNSTTVRQLVEAGLAGGATGIYTGDISQAGSVAAFVYAMRHGGTLLGQHINEGVARRVGELLASHDPAAISRGVQMVAHNPVLRRALEAADTGTMHLSNVAGQQGRQLVPNVPTGALSADEQPQTAAQR